MSQATSILVSGLGRGKLTELRKQAKALGMSVQTYAKQLIEDGLSYADHLDDSVRIIAEREKASTATDVPAEQVLADIRKKLGIHGRSRK
jgi:hypothetical protein